MLKMRHQGKGERKKTSMVFFLSHNFKAIILIVLAGLDNKKYYSAKGDDKANQEISKANTETDFNKREAVYAANRGALTYVIRSKQKNHFNMFQPL